MPENRPYKEVLASLETHIVYIKNHLGNIDQHLNKLNDRTSSNEHGIADNRSRIGFICKVSSWVSGAIFGGGIITIIVCRVIGVF